MVFRISSIIANSAFIFITLLISLLQVDLSREQCPEPIFTNLSYVNTTTKFARATSTSRYLIPTNIFVTGSKDGLLICRSLGLMTAYASNLADYWHIVNDIIKAKNFQKGDSSFAVLHAGWAREPGTYISPRTKEIIPFQMFQLASSHYFEEGKTCLSIECKNSSDCFFSPKVCKKPLDPSSDKVMPLCMYQPESKCFKRYARTESDELGRLGETDIRDYAVSERQKTWQDASATCAKHGHKLLSFIKNDTSETNKVMQLVDKFREALGTPHWAKSTWTGGRFDHAYGKSENFAFENDKDKWLYKDNQGHWEWISERLVQDPEEEVCLAIVSTSPMVIRPLSCNLPNYFICYKSKLNLQQGGRLLNLGLNKLLDFRKSPSTPPPSPPPPPPPQKPPPPPVKKPVPQAKESSSEQDDSSEETTTKPPRKKKAKTQVTTTKPSTPEPVPISASSEEEEEASSSERKATTQTTTTARPSESEFEPDEPIVNLDQEICIQGYICKYATIVAAIFLMTIA